MVYDGVTTVTAYVNGVAGTPTTIGQLDTVGGNVSLGTAPWTDANAGDQLRQFAIFGAALDGATIASMHAAIESAAAGMAFSDPANGTVTNNGTSVTYTPNPGFFGVDTFTYSVSDGQGGSASATVTVTVSGVAGAQPDNVTVTTGEVLIFDAVANDVIPEGLTASITSVVSPANGTAVILDDTTIEYTPNEGFVGTDTFTYTLTTEPGGETSQALVSVIVTPANQWPTAVDDTATTTMGNAIYIDVIANDSDPDGHAVYVSPGQLARGAILRAGPLLHWECLPESLPTTLHDTSGNGRTGVIGAGVTPASETGDCDNGTSMMFAGIDGLVTRDNPGLPVGQEPRSALVRYKANFTTEPADIPLFGYGQNGTPYAQFTVSRTILGNDKLIFTSWANDLHFDLPPGANIADGNEHNIMFVYDGDVTVFAYYDGIPSGQGTLAVPLNTIDDTVMLGASPWGWRGNGDELRQFAIFPIAISEDDAYLVHAAVEAAVLNRSYTEPRFGTLVESPDHLGFTYTPDPGYVGPDQFYYSISDGNGGGAIALVSIDVLPGVKALNDTAFTPIDTPVTIDVLANDGGQPGAVLTVTSVTQPAFGVASTDGTGVNFAPQAGWLGIATFTYTVESDLGGSDTATVAINVGGTGSNFPPIAVDDVATTFEETPVTINVLANDSDPDNDGLSISRGDSAIPGINAFEPSLYWACLPAAGSATLFDQSGNGVDGTINGSVTPGALADDCGGGTTMIFPNAGAYVGRTFPGLPQGDSARTVVLRYRTDISTPSTIGMFGFGTNAAGNQQFSVSRNLTGNNNLSFTAWGNDTVVELPVSIADGLEHTIAIVYDGGTTITGYVDGVAGTPATLFAPLATVDSEVVLGRTLWGAVGDAAEMRHFAVFEGALSGADIAEIHTIIESVVHEPAFTQGENGSVTQVAFDSLEYTPNAGFVGVDTFTYTVADGNGGESTATVTVTVEEAPLLDLTAVDDSAVTVGTDPVVIDVLANDLADPTATLVIDSVTTPDNGTAVIDGSTVTYTANPNFDGFDAFFYTVSDGLGNTKSAQVNITVIEAPNQPPVAVDDTATTALNTPVTIDVLGNDFDPDEGDTLSLGASAIGVLNGFAPSLYWSCLPNSGITVTDESGNGNDGTIQGNVLPGAVAGDCGGATPVFADGSALIFNSAPGSVPVGSSARTIVVRFRSDLGTPADVGLFGYGTNAVGLGQFSIARSSSGNDRLTYAMWGGDGVVMFPPGSNIADGNEHTIAVVYDGANTLTAYFDGVAGAPVSVPVLNTVNGQVMLGQTLYGAISAGAEMRHFAIYGSMLNSLDIQTIHSAIEAGSAPIFTQPANGTVTQVGNQLEYTPNEDFSGDDVFTYTVSDGNGGSATGTVTVTVLGNQPPVAVDDIVVTNQGQDITIDVMANDSDPENDTISFTPSLNAITTLNAHTPSLYWACLPPSGTTVPDQSGNGNDGTIQGNVAAGPTAGDCGGATPIFVDGTALILNDLPSTLPLGSAARTLVVRYRTDLAVPANVGLFGYGQNAQPLGQFSIARTAAGNDRLLFASWGGDNILHLPPGTNIADGQEHTLVVTYDGANTITGWVNGVAGTPATIPVLDTQNDIAMLGQTLYGAVSAGASMRHFAIYNGVLSAGAIAEIHAAIDAGGATAWTQPANGFVTQSGNSLVYAPNVGFVGTDSFTYVIQDEDGNVSDPATVTVTVEAVTLAPEDDTAFTQQDTPVTISVLDNDAGADLTVSGVTNGTNGTVTTGGTTVTYTPAPGFFGTDTFTVDVTDGLTTLTTTTTVTVNGAPTGPNLIFETDSEVPVFIEIIPPVTDPEGDELTIVAVGPASNGSVDVTDPAVTYTSNPDFGGTDTFEVTVEDEFGASVTITVTVIVNNNAAPIAVDDVATTNSPLPVTINVLANDSDPDGDPIQFASAISQMNSYSPSLYWTCLPETGTTVPDESGNGNDGTIQGNVIAGPIADDCGGAAPIFADGSALIFNSSPGSVPVGSDARTVVVRFRTDLATPSDVGMFGYGTNATGLGQFSVVRTATGNDRLWFETWGMGTLLMLPPGSNLADGDEHTIAIVYDGGTTITAYFDGVAGAPSTLFLPLNTVNGQVMLGQTLYGAVSAGASMRHFAIYDGTLTGSNIAAIHAAIEAGGSLSYTQGANGTVTRSGDQLVYTPNVGFVGTDSFTYTITDGKETASATVTVEVEEPLLEAVDDVAFTQQDTPVTIAVLFNDEGDDLEVSGTTDGANGTVTTDGTTVTYTPAPGFFGIDTFTVEVTDGFTTDTSTVTVTVNGAPVGPDQEEETPPATPVSISIVPPVTDPEDTILTITSAGPAGNGTVTIEDGDVVYTPEPGFVGTDTFEVTIEDEDGGSVTITVTVIVNTPLVANDDSAFTQQDTPVTVDVLDNDEGDTLVVAGVSQGANGTVVNNGTDVTYTPNAGFWGTDTFVVMVQDGDEIASTTTTITVNGAPVGDDLDEETTPETPVTISIVPPVTDPEGTDLTITSAGPAGNGTVTIEDGDVIYTPEPGFIGVDTFEVTIEDEDGGSLTITVTVTVDTPLEANDDSAFTQQDTPVTVSVLDNDLGDDLGVDAVTNGANGTVTTDGTTVTYTPNAGFFGTDTFTVTVVDNLVTGETATSTVTVTVNGAPTGPDLDDETAPETPVTISIVPPVSDPEGGPLTITSAGPAGNGTVTIEDGDVIYTPEPGFIGTDTFEVTIEDEDGGSTTITVTVLVHVALVANDDSAFTQQDTPVTVSVLNNDLGDDLSVIGTGTAANGTVTTDGTTVIYTPAPGFFGTDTFTVTIEDAIGGEPTATSTVTVTVNGAPTGPDIDAGTIPQNTPVTVGIIPPVTDPEGGPLTITSAGPAGNGTVTIDGDTVIYTPNPGYSGPDTFEVTIEDEDGGSVTISVTVNVNTPPVATDVELSTQAGVGVGFDSAASVTDPDGDDVEIIDITTPANGTVTTDGSSITYTPNAGFSGTDTFQVTVEDEYGDTATFTVTVDVNGAPVGDDINVATSEDVAIDIDLLAGVTDPDGDDLEVTNVTDPTNGTVSVLNGVATYTPAAGFTGIDSFEVTIEDGNGGSLTITVTVTVDGAPRIILTADACVAVVTQVSDSGYLSEFWLEAPGTPSFLGITDESPAGTQVVLGTYPAGTELVLSIHVTNTGHVFQSGPGYRNPDGLVHIELTPGTGDVLYTVGFEDLLGGGDLDFNDAVIDVVAVDCGVTAVDDSVETEEDNAIDIDALVNDSTEHGTLAITDVTDPANGTVTELNGVFTYIPAAGFYGTDTFTYTVENGFGGSDTATVTVTVLAAPRVVLASNACVIVEVQQHGPVAYTNQFWLEAPGAPQYLGIDNWDIGEQATLGYFEAGTELVLSIHVTNTGHVFKTGPAYNNPDNFVHVIVTPGTGDVLYTVAFEDLFNGGDQDYNDAIINVIEVPCDVEAVDDSAFTQQDSAVTVDVLDNDGGVELEVTSVTQGTNGSVTTDGTSATYTPNAAFYGTDTFTYTAGNGLGSPDTATVTVTVNGAPQGDDIEDTTAPETPVSIPVIPTVTDPEGTDLTITGTTTPANGTVVIDGDNVVYTPNDGFIGIDSFEVTIEDEDGGSLTITVTVDVNTPLVANDDTAFTQQETPVTVSVLDNDEGDAPAVDSVSNGANGTATTDGTTVTYTPNAGFFGTDTVTVTVVDGSETQTSTLTVTVNGAPTGPDIDAGVIQIDTPVGVQVIPPVSDPEGGPLAITSAGPATNGTVTIAGDTVIYTPNPGYTGPDSFQVTIEDEDGGSLTITVTVFVNAPPTATDVELSTIEGVGVGFATGSVIIEPDGDDVSIVDLGTPSNGTVTTDGSSITYLPNPGFSGTDSFLVTIADTYGAQATFTVTVDVNGAPQGDDIATETEEDVAVDIDVLAGITDPEGDDLSIVDVTAPSNGTVTIDAGVATYTPAAGFFGTDSFDVTIEDEAGNSLTITVTVTVNAAPRVILAADACIAVVAQGGDAGYTNQFWLEAPGTPSFLGITNRSTVGTTVPVGTFTAGTELVLSIHVVDTGHVFQTGPAYNNPDNVVHVVVTPGTGDLLYTVGFEDLLNGGDLDFNDAVIDVIAIDCGVEAQDDAAETTQDTPVDIAVLGNDSTENGELEITNIGTPANGTVTEANGVLTYSPNAGFSGTDSFTYTVENGLGGTATATVTVEVEEANMVVLAETACIAIRVEQHGVVTYTNQIWLESPGAPQYLGIDNWDVGDQVTLGTFSAGTELILSIHVQNTGHVFKTGPAYRNPDNFVHAYVTPGTGNVLYTVEFEDLYNGGDQDYNDAIVSVLSIDCGITAVDDAATTEEGERVDIDVLDNDSSEGALEVVAVTQPAHGDVDIEDDGVIEYDPDNGFTGVDTFTYTVENEFGETATATVTVTVVDGDVVTRGKMTGGGNYQTGSGNNKKVYNWGFELRCSTGGGHFNYHDEANKLHVNNISFTSFVCFEDDRYDNDKDFNTVEFSGTAASAQYGNSHIAVTIEAVVVDKGTNGKNDTLTITVRRASDGQILSQLNNVKLKGGNHVAHNN